MTIRIPGDAIVLTVDLGRYTLLTPVINEMKKRQLIWATPNWSAALLVGMEEAQSNRCDLYIEDVALDKLLFHSTSD